MLIIPFLITLLIIILILLSPFIFKSIYKNKKCFGYGVGFSCSIVIFMVNCVLLLICAVQIGLCNKDYFKLFIDNLTYMNNNFNFEEIFSLSTEKKNFIV